MVVMENKRPKSIYIKLGFVAIGREGENLSSSEIVYLSISVSKGN